MALGCALCGPLVWIFRPMAHGLAINLQSKDQETNDVDTVHIETQTDCTANGASLKTVIYFIYDSRCITGIGQLFHHTYERPLLVETFIHTCRINNKLCEHDFSDVFTLLQCLKLTCLVSTDRALTNVNKLYIRKALIGQMLGHLFHMIFTFQ